jgi:rRNA maturation RNase YbeY
MNIEFHFQKKISLVNRKGLREFINYISKKERTQFSELNFIFCSDQYLLEINKNFLRHNYNTDIITFDLSDNNKYKKGEIYISVDRVKDNAKTFNKFIYNELHRVLFHGLLHLCGYKDKKPDEIFLMRKKEDFYLDKYFNNV